MAYVVAATWKAKPGEADRITEVIRIMTPLSRQEPGNLFYQAQVSPEAETFFLYEQYTDAQAYEDHKNSEHPARVRVRDRLPRRAQRQDLPDDRCLTVPDGAVTHRLLLLRHGEVPPTAAMWPSPTVGWTAPSGSVGAWPPPPAASACSPARRSGPARPAPPSPPGPERPAPPPTSRVAFALRNPDLYVAGERVNMVSSAAALAEQVPGMTEDEAAVVPFFAKFFSHPDRIGWWLRFATSQATTPKPWPAGSTTSPASPTGPPSRPVSPSGSRIRPCCAPVHWRTSATTPASRNGSPVLNCPSPPTAPSPFAGTSAPIEGRSSAPGTALLDPHRIAPCMPGASFESVEGDAFTGNVMIKLGPIDLSRSAAALGQRKGLAATSPCWWAEPSTTRTAPSASYGVMARALTRARRRLDSWRDRRTVWARCERVVGTFSPAERDPRSVACARRAGALERRGRPLW